MTELFGAYYDYRIIYYIPDTCDISDRKSSEPQSIQAVYRKERSNGKGKPIYSE